MTEQILGGKILKGVKDRCQPYSSYFQGKLITIVMFQPPEELTDAKILGQYRAAVTSTNQKVKTFEFLGCEVKSFTLPGNTEPERFGDILKGAANNRNSLAIIVQNPIPGSKLKLELGNIPPRLDIDGINENRGLFKASATSESIARLAQSFAIQGSKVAVVGAGGFVGRGVVRLLEDSQIQCLKIDMGDDLLRTHEADIVVSCTGEAELLDKRHILPSHRLVVDSGFIPQADGSIKGDVNRSAYDIPQYLTPVPGGVGPMQMATLLERIVELTQEQSPQKWTIETQSAEMIGIPPDILDLPDMTSAETDLELD
ncbi:bifunctional 5,10-methylenetetrahydrofolate dehydrogenase/5,10-methenyltetrahydrofolate cyclohydrolase [Merismopedia glauca]|uniref:methenyltetrahydrofolate cyclohydrolase n=1 Tax=Merismopedia glauca CCAP 1448/3 TaxID=1296344 RepID=A0A2T1BWQ8_9CYAN|nr:bifunctional 5,10-methylenetetrahydrofolate dehydrogenase/5,10-methenyltetrahydrofolate cyclohydrolase [Merismopedia glauca]PSB00388.1 methylenetetrahydrofolate dehydrogenase [Merismopedia glauca CCAP 1448/3]